MKQRKWSAEEKFAIVLEGLKGKRAVADICREHQIRRRSIRFGDIGGYGRG